jgi:phosphatidate cytidylyltransferase
MLKVRVVTALCLLAIFLSALFFLSPLGWLAVAVLVAGVAAWEWGALMGWSGGRRSAYPILVGAVVAALGVATGLDLGGVVARHPMLTGVYLAGAAFWLLCVPAWLLRKWRAPGALSGGVTGLFVLVPAALALAHARQVSPGFLLACMAAVWLADIGAYFFGRAFGRHKLAPAISPGKSWEGAIGGALVVTLYGLGLALAAGRVSLAGLGLVLAVLALLAFAAVSVEGDLFESLLKRQAGLKDSGTILPGHGGVLDRIDSLTSTLPLVGLAVLYHFAP